MIIHQLHTVYCNVFNYIGSELLQVQNICSFQKWHFWFKSSCKSLLTSKSTLSEHFPKISKVTKLVNHLKVTKLVSLSKVSLLKNFWSSWRTLLASSPFLAFCMVFWFFWKTHFLLCFTQLSNQNKRCQQKSLIALILWLRFNSCFSSFKRLYQYMISFEANQLSKMPKNVI